MEIIDKKPVTHYGISIIYEPLKYRIHENMTKSVQ